MRSGFAYKREIGVPATSLTGSNAMILEIDSWELREIVQGAIEEKFPDRQHFRDRVIFELMISQLTAFPDFLESMDASMDQRDEHAKNLAASNVLWRWIEKVIGLADTALTRYPDDGQTIKRWSHQAPQQLDRKKDVDNSASLETLRDCATTYGNAEWARSPTLELWLVRQMIFAETFAFSRETGIPIQYKSFNFWWMWSKSLVKWSIGLGVSISIGDAHGPAVGVLAFVAWLSLIKYLAKDQLDGLLKLTETVMYMRNCYVLSLRDPACPIEIEKSLSLAEGHGAVWPAGLRGLVERGISRNRTAWL